MATEIERARISLRISTQLWIYPERWAETRQFVTDYADFLDEVAFFTSEIHPPLPLPVIEERAEILTKLIAEMNALGVTAGINHLSTVGHLDEYAEYALSEPWQRFVDVNGVTSATGFCPQDPRMRRYIADSYIALAKAKPAFIWIDDDVRLGGHSPAGYTCFCDGCVARFSRESGSDWTRETLKAAFNGGELPERLALRKQWLAHNRAVMSDIFTDIRSGVDTVDPSLQLGWMSCELGYEGFDYDNWYRALEGAGSVPPKSRPGGGFYADSGPGDMIAKAHSIGLQTALIPESVTDIQSEHENFPYQVIRKSIQTFGNEIGVYIASGCTGCALNLMGMTPDPVDEFRPLMERVRAWKPFYDAAAASFGRSACEGLWSAYTKDAFAARGADGDWFGAPGETNGRLAGRDLAEIGLPTAYTPEGASVTLFGGDSVVAFSREELERLLTGGVMLDGSSLARLHEAGLGDLVGFRVAGTKDHDTIEQFTADPINGRFSGWRRDTRPSFWKTTSYLIEATASEARPLAEIVDIYGKVAGLGSGVFENRLGGRVAVMGYSPWSMVMTLAKTEQLKALSRWLSRDTVPAYVATYHRAAIWCRRGADGRLGVFVFNMTHDTAEGMALHVREDRPLQFLRPGGDWQPLASAAKDGPYSVLELPAIAPWEIALIA